MKFIRDNELFLLEETIKRNFSSKYKDSVLGIFWTILRPLLYMAMFTIIFSTIFSKTIENYPIYLLTGRCVYEFFSHSVTTSMYSIKSSKSILQKVSAPKYIFILGSVISEFINFLITLVLLFCVIVVTNFPIHYTVLLSFIPIVSLMIMNIGLGLILAIANMYYSDIQHLWSVGSLALMYASAIFYPMQIVPQPFRQYMMLNPVYWVIDQFRSLVYVGIIPDTLNMVNSLLLSIIILVIGIIVFKKFEKRVSMKF